MQRIPMTVKGEAKLKSELDHLKSVARPRIIASIATAREHGDLKENAEYHAAREEQGFVEGRIQEIEFKVSNSQVIDISKISNHGKVIFGATVHLLNIDTDEESFYQIVGEDEADVKARKISVGSPIARALIGKESGDDVTVRTPAGNVDYEISEIEYI
jgi:transcription elongation factor GreA